MSVFGRFADTVRGGLSVWWLAPLVPLIVVLPEFVQHIAEIRMGMFADKAAFDGLAQDPRRMSFGIVKVIALLLAIFAAARFWATRGGAQRWWNPRGILWGRLVLAIVLASLVGIPGILLEDSIGVTGRQVLDAVLTLATLPLFTWLVSALLADRDMTWKRVWRSGWLPGLRIAIFAALLWAPLQWLHGQTHIWAMGADVAVVWLLMIFDSLVVGLLATLAGSALFFGYGAEYRNKEGELSR